MGKFTESSTSHLTILEAKDNAVRVKLQVATVNTVNSNGRYYSKEVYQTANDAAQNDLKEGRLWGLLDHPNWEDPSKGSVEQIVIKYDKLYIEDITVYAEGVLVNTQKGKDLHELSKAGVKLGVSTNGYGSTQWIKASEFLDDFPYPDQYIAVMQPDYRYNTIDIVTTPSNSGGEISSMEGQIMTLEDLKKNDPNGYAKLMAEATAKAVSEAKTAVPTVTVASNEAMEKQLETLTAQIAARDARDASSEREAIARILLNEAKLPKLPVAEGALDVNATFEARVIRIATAAATVEAAKTAVEAEIAERKVLLSALPKIEDTTENGVIIPEKKTAGNVVTEMVSIRNGIGLL